MHAVYISATRCPICGAMFDATGGAPGIPPWVWDARLLGGRHLRSPAAQHVLAVHMHSRLARRLAEDIARLLIAATTAVPDGFAPEPPTRRRLMIAPRGHSPTRAGAGSGASPARWPTRWSARGCRPGRACTASYCAHGSARPRGRVVLVQACPTCYCLISHGGFAHGWPRLENVHAVGRLRLGRPRPGDVGRAPAGPAAVDDRQGVRPAAPVRRARGRGVRRPAGRLARGGTSVLARR